MAVTSELISSAIGRLRSSTPDISPAQIPAFSGFEKPTFAQIIASEELRAVKGNLQAEDAVIAGQFGIWDYRKNESSPASVEKHSQDGLEMHNKRAEGIIRRLRDRVDHRAKARRKQLEEAFDQGELIFRYDH